MSQKTINRVRTKAITVIGINDDGCLGLPARAVQVIAKSQVLVGGERHLEYFPQFEGLRIPIKGKISDVIDQIQDLANEHNVAVLSSGDPLYYGIGGRLVKEVGLENVEIISQPGSIPLAFARIGVNWEDAFVISLHGRPRKGFITKIQAHRKIAVFTDDENSPQALAGYMLKFGEEGWKAWVCERLGGVEERIRFFSLEELSQTTGIAELNVLILLRESAQWTPSSVMSFLHEDEFEKRMPKKGLITKREVRLLSLGFMRLKRDAVVWDIGTASGSVAIAAAQMCPGAQVYAIEVDSESVEICKQNLITHKVDNVDVIEGRAPEALKGLPAPDSVFIGGSKGSMRDILELSFDQLKENGTIVVNAITLENVQEAYQYFKEKELNPEIVLLNVSRGVPLAKYHRYEALNPIHIFAVSKIKTQAVKEGE